MKKLILSGCFVWMAFFICQAQNLRTGSYNLRFANKSDVGNEWENRAAIVANLIRFHDFDILGTQEGLINQLEDISKALPAYERYGAGRDDGKTNGEHSAIFYKKDKFKLLQKGDFWLSETPEKPSLGWDATCCNRICSWIELQDNKTKKRFFVFNVHFDHQGVVARVESAKLILQKIKTIAANKPVILTGDFNGDPNSEWYKTIATSGFLKDAYTLAEHPYVNNGSFNSFKPNNVGKTIIDHIFITKDFSVQKYGLLTDTYYGKFPSDHFPILVDVKM